MLKQNQEILKSLAVSNDLLIIGLAWFFSRLIASNFENSYLAFDVFLLIPAIIIFLVVISFFGLYKTRRFKSELYEAKQMLSASCLSFLIITSFYYFMFPSEVSQYSLLVFFALSIVGLLAVRVIVRKVLKVLRRSGYNQRYALIVGTGDMAKKLAVELEHNLSAGVRVRGFLSGEEEKVGTSIVGIPVLGHYSKLCQVLEVCECDQVLFALPHDQFGELDLLLSQLQVQGCSLDVRVAANISKFMTVGADAELFHGVPLITLQASPVNGYSVIHKRLLDIIIASCALVITLPLMLVTALLIKLTSAGPVIYRQCRVGWDGHPFDIFKFRTMKYCDIPVSDKSWTIKNDPRRTWLGVFLRKYAIDELPQFWNVLKGDMSVVGPRPEQPLFVEKFRKTIPNYMVRHKIKVGITGLAQINGLRGDTSIEERIKYDLKYIHSWSIWLDCKIVFLTIFNGWYDKNAY